MKFPAGNGYTVRLEQIDRLGTTWIVRVHKKSLLFRSLVSSDWFLDGTQARRFAEQIAGELRSGGDTGNITHREPGWTLRRPAH
jgi:hypothetical protein